MIVSKPVPELASDSIPARHADTDEVGERACSAWLARVAGDTRPSLALAVAAGFGNGLAAIAQAALLAFVLNQIIVQGEGVADVVPHLCGLLALFLCRGVCVYVAECAGFDAAAGVRRSVRARIMEKLLRLGPAYSGEHHSGALASVALEQVDALEGYFARYLPQRMLAVLIPAAIVLAVFPLNWVVAVIFLVTGPLIPFFMVLIGIGAAAASRRQFRTLARMSGHFLDRLQGLTTLKLFGQARRELAVIRRVSDEYRERTLGVLGIAFLSSAVLEFFSAVALALVAVYVGLGLLGLIGFGPAASIDLFAGLFVLLLAPDFFLPLRQLAACYHDRAAAVGAAEALLRLLEAEENRPPGDRRSPVAVPEGPVSIEFRCVSKSYEGGRRPALKDLSFRVEPGEKLAVVAPSGGGKSTLISLLLGFQRADRGTILIDGRDIADMPDAWLHSRIAWVGQSPHLFHGSIFDNIALGDPAASASRVEAAAAAAAVTEFTRSLRDGLATVIGERGASLSGGQVQRVALARAFLKDAPLLLLDEPTANLDRDNQARILGALDQLFRRRTVIVATHSAAVIARTDRQVYLPCYSA